MKLSTQQHGSVRVLAPHGPLAGDDVSVFRDEMVESAAQCGGRVVLDLQDVPYVDSAGIEALLDTCAASGATELTRVANLTETCREALDLTDTLQRLYVFDTVENAIRSLRR